MRCPGVDAATFRALVGGRRTTRQLAKLSEQRAATSAVTRAGGGGQKSSYLPPRAGQVLRVHQIKVFP